MIFYVSYFSKLQFSHIQNWKNKNFTIEFYFLRHVVSYKNQILAIIFDSLLSLSSERFKVDTEVTHRMSSKYSKSQEANTKPMGIKNLRYDVNK
jgi:hypothetical protein